MNISNEERRVLIGRAARQMRTEVAYLDEHGIPACDRIREAVPTSPVDSRTMGDWGDEVMERHRDCCRLQSWYNPKAKRYQWYRLMSKIVTFDYRGLRIKAEVINQDTVDEWTAFDQFDEIPYSVWEILNGYVEFMVGLRELAIKEARL